VLNKHKIASLDLRFKGISALNGGSPMRDCKVTPEMAAVIKLARAMGIPYSWITGYYFGLNFGRIADVISGRRFRDVPAATALPSDFPTP